MINEKFLKIAFFRQKEVVALLKRKNYCLTSFFDDQQIELEFMLSTFKKFSSQSPEFLTCLEAVISNYSKFSKFLKEILIKTLYRNLSEFIGNKGVN